MAETNSWQQILSYLQCRLNAVSFDTWLKPTYELPGSNGRLFVRVPHLECEEWIQEHWHDDIVNAIRSLKLPVSDIEYRVPTPDPIPEIPRDEDEKGVEEDDAWYGIAKEYRHWISEARKRGWRGSIRQAIYDNQLAARGGS